MVLRKLLEIDYFILFLQNAKDKSLNFRELWAESQSISNSLLDYWNSWLNFNWTFGFLLFLKIFCSSVMFSHKIRFLQLLFPVFCDELCPFSTATPLIANLKLSSFIADLSKHMFILSLRLNCFHSYLSYIRNLSKYLKINLLSAYRLVSHANELYF